MCGWGLQLLFLILIFEFCVKTTRVLKTRHAINRDADVLHYFT
jgi:hypothetical protein